MGARRGGAVFLVLRLGGQLGPEAGKLLILFRLLPAAVRLGQGFGLFAYHLRGQPEQILPAEAHLGIPAAEFRQLPAGAALFKNLRLGGIFHKISSCFSVLSMQKKGAAVGVRR